MFLILHSAMMSGMGSVREIKSYHRKALHRLVKWQQHDVDC